MELERVKFSKSKPLSWIDDSGRCQMAVLSVESRGFVRCESTTMGTEILERSKAESFVGYVLANGGQFLPSKRKLSNKQILSNLNK